MAFAYFDKYDVLHVVDSKQTAEQYGNGKFVECDIPNGGGYPKVLIGDKYEHVIMERGHSPKVGGRRYRKEHPMFDFLQPVLEQLK